MLAIVAHALLAVIATHEHADQPAPAGLIELTCNEIRRLLTIFVIEPGRALTSPKRGPTGGDVTNTVPAPPHYRRQEAASAWT